MRATVRPMTASTDLRRRRRRALRVVVVVVGLLVVVNLLIFAGRETQQGDEREPLPAAIESIEPIEEGIVSSNGSIRVDLRDDTTGVILLDGTEIPEDQLDRTPDLGIVEYRPQEDPDTDAEMTRFEPGRHRATVLYWPRTGTRADAESFSWDFRVGG